MKRNKALKIAFFSCYAIFVVGSFIFGFNPGKAIGNSFITFCVFMLSILPCAFILIGLFETWVKKETIEKHMGKRAGGMSHVWGVLLASTTVGGIYVAFPVAYSLFSKGAKLSVIFTYLGASAICRIPMAIFEASFLGIKFTIIRLLVSIPLVILASSLLGNYLTRRGYQIKEARG